VSPSLITVGFGSSFQLLNRGFCFAVMVVVVEEEEEEEEEEAVAAAVGREKEGEEAGKYAWLIKLQAWRNRLPRP
jgi:hypothetical protein